MFLLLSCVENENDMPVPPPTNGGTDFFDVDDFMIRLDADSLRNGEIGVWNIFTGEVGEKVAIENTHDPKTIFHGLPGEQYKLLWTVRKGMNSTTDTVTVSFAALKTEIFDHSPDYHQTRRMLEGKSYDRGEWTIEGEYHHLRGISSGGIVPSEQFKYPTILLYGLENTSVKATWTTWYGSKSASASIAFSTGEYHQKEALEELAILYDYSYYKENGNGDVVELSMLGDRKAWMFEDIEQFPELKALKHLERLILSGNPIYKFPQVVTHYTKLKFLALMSNYFTEVPEEFGSLTELDTLYITATPVTSLPSSLGNLKKLKYLDLSNLKLSSVPESLSDLRNLNFLNLELSTIDKLPENFGNLRNLETFRGPTLLQNIPPSFSQLSNLRFCFFFTTVNAAVLPENFGNLTKLDTLWLQGNYSRLPESFANLVNLKSLEITRGSGLTKIPEQFGNLANLQTLTLVIRLDRLPSSFTSLRDLRFLNLYGKLNYLPSDIGKLSKLEGMQVSSIGIKELPESIGQLTNLWWFSAASNEISSIPESIGNLSNLSWLSLSRNQITHFPSSMAKLSGTLKDLFVNGNRYSDEELVKLKKMLPITDITTYQPGD